MKKTRMTVMALALLTALSLTGGTALAENTEAAAKTVTGRVTQVSASAITVELGTYTAPTAPGRGADASSSATVKPEATAPEATAPEATEAPDAAQDAETNPAPDAAAQDGNQSAASGFTSSGESLTFTLTDSTVITVGTRNRKGSVSDIAVGSILTVQLSGDAATSITVIQTGGSGRGFDQDAQRGSGKARNDRNRGDNRGGKDGRRGNAPDVNQMKPEQDGAPAPDSGAANPSQSTPDSTQNMPGA